MPFFKSNNSELFYEVHGKEQPLLLIAGLASDSQSWQYILKQLSKKYQLIIYDNRGTGRAIGNHKSFTIEEMTDDAIALLDHLQIKKAHVLGHSMGGCIAQTLAVKAPEYIDKLILASTTTFMSNRNKSLFEYLIATWQEGVPQEQWIKNLFYWLFSPNAFKNLKFIDAAVIFTLCYPYPQTLESFKAQVNALIQFDSTDFIKDIKAKTMIMSGENDILVYPEESKKLLGISGNTSFKIIEKAAHSIHAEYPEEFTREVSKFLG
ncbi:alpha/beta fold hydrolase [Bacteroidota bacterium]